MLQSYFKGPSKSLALPFFHAFTGCDTVSAFYGRGKNYPFEAWNAYPAVTNAFIQASEGKVDETFNKLEKFVVLMW